MNRDGAAPARARPMFWMALVTLFAVCIEVGSYLVELASGRLLSEPIRRRSAILREQTVRIAALLDTTRSRREQLDPVLGWRYRAGYASDDDHLNAQGLRSRHEYAAAPPAGTLRVAAFGDSFVYGNEVTDDDAWTAVLEGGSGGIEVLNYGVGGYGLDQAFLRFQAETRDRFETGSLSKEEAQLAIEHFWAGALRRAAIDGDVENGSVMAGQSVGMVTAEQPTTEIIEELVGQAVAALAGRTNGPP